MNAATLAVKNLGRDKLRTFLTVLGIAVAIFFFVVMRSLIASWTGAIEYAAQDRLGTRHKVTFIMPLPKRYVDDIRALPEVEAATFMNWFGGKDASRPDEFFGTIAVETETVLDVFREIEVPSAQAEAWKQNRQGALVGDQIAKKFGWKVGDKVVLSGTIFPGEWDFIIEGIYTSKSKAIDRSTFWFHWKYLNESIPAERRDTIGWVTSRVRDASQSAQVSKKIDAIFDTRDVQTLTQSEKALQQSFMGMVSAFLGAIDWVSAGILLIFMLILGNTIAMSVRERTGEYGCMRAIGFSSGHIARFIIGEAVAIGILGGLVGLGFAMVVINGAVGPWIEENMGSIFPYFRVDNDLVGLSLALAAVLAALASLIPAMQASRLKVVDALRNID